MASPQTYLPNRRSENQVELRFDYVCDVVGSNPFNKPSMINDYDAVAHPSGRSPVRIGRYLLASVEHENGKRNKPNMINDWA